MTNNETYRIASVFIALKTEWKKEKYELIRTKEHSLLYRVALFSTLERKLMKYYMNC